MILSFPTVSRNQYCIGLNETLLLLSLVMVGLPIVNESSAETNSLDVYMNVIILSLSRQYQEMGLYRTVINFAPPWSAEWPSG